jgi:hypothetical protein
LWHFAHWIDMPRNAWLTVSAISVGSSWRTKKLPAPFSSVPPRAVTIWRTNRSQGVFAATWLRIHA